MGRSAVPVLCYHNLGANGVPRASFEAQMRWLKEQGARTLTLAELRRYIAGELPLDRPAVALTFDDGFRDLYTYVLPIFRELELRGTVFVINNRIRPPEQQGQEGEIDSTKAHREFMTEGLRRAWLNAEELKALIASGCFQAGSHSATHLMLPVGPPCQPRPDHWAYANLDAQISSPVLAPELGQPCWTSNGQVESMDVFQDRVKANLHVSLEELKELVDVPVASFAWPWGAWSAEAEVAAEEAGVEMAFTLERRPVRPGDSPMRLGRIEVRKNKGMDWFASRLAVYSRSWTARLYGAMRR